MSEISFVQTLLLFIMSSCPNLLWEALAPSLPSSGKKLKLNPKVREKKSKETGKELCLLFIIYALSVVQKFVFFPCHLLSHSNFWEKTQKYCFLEKSIIIHGQIYHYTWSFSFLLSFSFLSVSLSSCECGFQYSVSFSV